MKPLKVDQTRLLRLEQARNIDLGAYEKADNEVRALRKNRHEFVKERDDLKRLEAQTPEGAKKRYAKLQFLNSEIEALRVQVEHAEAIRLSASEQFQNSQRLWDACAKHVGVI